MSADDGTPVLAGLVQDDFQLTLQYLLSRMRAFPGTGSVVTQTGRGIERSGDGPNLLEGVLVADGMHSIPERDVLDIEFSSGFHFRSSPVNVPRAFRRFSVQPTS